MIQKENKNEASYAVVRFLNRIGLPVCEIDGRFYTVKMFEEANQGSWKHSLEGKDISTLINSFVHINEMDDSQRPAVIQKLESCQEIKKFFHKDIKFVLHLQ